MATAKPKGPVKVHIDAGSAVKLEKALRKGLTGSPAYIIDVPPKPRPGPKKSMSVQLDARMVARFANHLRKKVTASGAYIFPDEARKKK